MMVFDDIAKRGIRFQTCRGLLGLDLIFGRPIEKEFEHLSDDELICLAEILTFQDREPLPLINGSCATDKARLASMLEKIRWSRSNGYLWRQWRPSGNEGNGRLSRYFYKGVI